jgi:hypothetical protein
MPAATRIMISGASCSMPMACAGRSISARTTTICVTTSIPEARSRYYRTSTLGHNTIVIDGHLGQVEAEASLRVGVILSPDEAVCASLDLATLNCRQRCIRAAKAVDNPDALAELLAERVAIARRSRFIIEPLDHGKRGSSGTPPIFERHTSAAREAGEMHRRPAFDLRKYFRIRRRRQPARPRTVTQSLPFILTSVALRKPVPSGVAGPMRPPAASRVTLRTSEGRSTAKQRATRLPKA